MLPDEPTLARTTEVVLKGELSLISFKMENICGGRVSSIGLGHRLFSTHILVAGVCEDDDGETTKCWDNAFPMH